MRRLLTVIARDPAWPGMRPADGRRAGLSDASDHHDRAVPRRRRHRHAGALPRPSRCGPCSVSPSSSRTSAGAAGSIGVGRAVRSPADGYTLSIGTSTTHMLTGGLYALPFDLLKDLEPIILIGSEPLLIVGKKSLPADDLKGLIAWLKANPDKASVGIAGVGATGHLTGISFQKETGTKFQFVPYRGNAPAMQDLLAGADRFHDRAVVEFQVAARRRQRQAVRGHRQDAAAVVAGYSDRGRSRVARLLRLALVRAVGARRARRRTSSRS